MNKVMLLGNIGQDPELKVLQNGQAVLKFSMATEEKWKDKEGEVQKRTDWHRCELWGKRAESLAKHLTKGSKVLVEGSLKYGSYEKDGVKHYTTDIKVLDLHFAGGKRSEGGGSDAPPAPSDDAPGDVEIPF